MRFSYKAYIDLLDKLSEHRYKVSDYCNWVGNKKSVILRHDIDYDIAKAVKIAAIEHEAGVFSTFFVLVTSDFYNLFSRDSYIQLRQIIGYGHRIGLHFDEIRYPEISCHVGLIVEKILSEASILSNAVECDVNVVSMHRPSKNVLEADLEIPGMINSYGRTFFHEFKYVSDSRHMWREPIEEIIKKDQYERLHILTHAFWYDDMDYSLEQCIKKFVKSGSTDRYSHLAKNFTDLDSVLRREQIL